MGNYYSEVYNALADIVFKHRGEVTAEDIEQACEWFHIHFWDDEYEADDEK